MPEIQRDAHEVEMVVGALLRWGVLTSAAITALGGAILLWTNGRATIALGTFRGESAAFTTFGGILHGSLAGDGAAVVQLGVAVLIATPVLRVAFTLLAFLHQRDRLYTVVTALVLAILLFSFVAGGAG